MAPHRTAIPISHSVTLEMAVNLWYTVSSVPDSGPREMLATCWASAATGQMGPPNASWWTTTPFDPFFVCAMQIIALSAVRRFVNLLECWRSTPLRHSLMSHSRNGMVCFARYVAGEVYSPTRRR
jgi:hypothetical protein